jgi:hypothetical protein
VPEESETAHFQMLLPKKWNWSNGLKPMVVQLAGTGDHVISKRHSLTNIIKSILLLFQVFLAPANSNGQTAFERMECRLHHPGESILRTTEAERAKVRISQTLFIYLCCRC